MPAKTYYHLWWNESQTTNAGAELQSDEDIPNTTFSKVIHPSSSSSSFNSKDMSDQMIKGEKQEKMEDQLKEITEFCKTFWASIGIREKNQLELCTEVQAQSSKRPETEVASVLNNCNSKIEALNHKVNTHGSASRITTASSTGANPVSQFEQKNSPKCSEGLITVGSPSLQYHGQFTVKTAHPNLGPPAS